MQLRPRTLPQQLAFLVGVPVVLLLIFSGLLLCLFFKSEQEARLNEHSKLVIYNANTLVKQYYDAVSRLIIFKQSRDENTRVEFESKLAATDDSFRELGELLKNDTIESRRMFVQLRRICALGMSLMKKYEDHIAGDTKLNSIEVAILYKEFDDCGAAFTSKLNDLIALETARHKVNSRQEEQTKTIMLCLIIAGAVGAVGTGTFLWLYFVRTITSRVALVMDNTLRLTRKEPLRPPMKGEDELAHLDLFFHYMAEELEKATRKQFAILDNAVDVICSIDAAGKFVSMNPASEHVWGYKPEALTGQSYAKVLFTEDVPKFEQALAEIRQSTNLVNIENRVLASDGRVVHTLWSLRWSEAEQSLFCVAHDISDRKEVERVKQEFVAVISHELRTPLTSLQMTLSLLLDGTYGTLSGTAQKRIRSAEFGIGRLISLINDLLDIEKMEAGKLTMNYSNVDIAEIAQRSLDSVQGFAEQQRVSVLGDFSSVEITADADRVIQVIVNLLSNAIKFSNEDSFVRLVVEKKGNICEVKVVDQGAGVPPGTEDMIFEKYGQAHTDRSKRKRGTGLGLPICKAIIEQHGGTIGVSPTAGGGSTFWFRLPVVAQSAHITPGLTLATDFSVGAALK